MKVGEYARLNNTLYNTVVILKIMGVYDNTILTENDGSIFQGVYGKDEIINHSYNIIDLIERFDLVNGHLVICKMYGNEKDIPTIVKCVGDYYFKEEDIKSVVTREQIESMEYKICTK